MISELLIVETEQPTPRSAIVGWTHEDASLVKPDRHIGMTPSPRPSYRPDCVLRAMARGWQLIGPPVENPGTPVTWVWYLTRPLTSE